MSETEKVLQQALRESIPERSETKHTPGPWSTARHRLRSRIHPGLGEWWECSVHVGNESPGNAIAIVYMGGPGATTYAEEAVYANAKLIATAPELADAVEALLLNETSSYCEHCCKHAPKDHEGQIIGPIPHMPECSAEIAREALRKAGRL